MEYKTIVSVPSIKLAGIVIEVYSFFPVLNYYK